MSNLEPSKTSYLAELQALSRRDLQAVAKQHGLKANRTSAALINDLVVTSSSSSPENAMSLHPPAQDGHEDHMKNNDIKGKHFKDCTQIPHHGPADSIVTSNLPDTTDPAKDAKQLSEEVDRSITGCQKTSHYPVSPERRPHPPAAHPAAKSACDATCDTERERDHIRKADTSRSGQEAGNAAAANGAANSNPGSGTVAAGNKSRKQSQDEHRSESSPAGEAAAKRPRNNGTRWACLVDSASTALGTSPLRRRGRKRKNKRKRTTRVVISDEVQILEAVAEYDRRPPESETFRCDGCGVLILTERFSCLSCEAMRVEFDLCCGCYGGPPRKKHEASCFVKHTLQSSPITAPMHWTMHKGDEPWVLDLMAGLFHAGDAR